MAVTALPDHRRILTCSYPNQSLRQTATMELSDWRLLNSMPDFIYRSYPKQSLRQTATMELPDWRVLDNMPEFSFAVADQLRRAMYRAQSDIQVVANEAVMAKRLAMNPLPTMVWEAASEKADPKWVFLAMEDDEFDGWIRQAEPEVIASGVFDKLRKMRADDTRSLDVRRARVKAEMVKVTPMAMPDGTRVDRATADAYSERLIAKIEKALHWSRKEPGFTDANCDPPYPTIDGVRGGGKGEGSLFARTAGDCTAVKKPPPRADLYEEDKWFDPQTGKTLTAYVPKHDHPEDVDLQLLAPNEMPLTEDECEKAARHIRDVPEVAGLWWPNSAEQMIRSTRVQWITESVAFACRGHRPTFDYLRNDKMIQDALHFSASCDETETIRKLHSFHRSLQKASSSLSQTATAKNRQKREDKKRRAAEAKQLRQKEMAKVKLRQRWKSAITTVIKQIREDKRKTLENQQESERRRRIRAARSEAKARQQMEWEARTLPGIGRAKWVEAPPSESDVAAAQGRKAIALLERNKKLHEQALAKKKAEEEQRKIEQVRAYNRMVAEKLDRSMRADTTDPRGSQ